VKTLANGWHSQTAVIRALMMRELVTRFGRENIGFLWMMAEPLLFAVLVGFLWRFARGPEDHGISVFAFVATGYIPLTLFRHCSSRCIRVIQVNSTLMYHRQIKLLDFIFVRVLIEVIGACMAFVFIGVVLGMIGEFPMPADVGAFLLGWFLYCLFVFSICLVMAPLSEMSDVLEKVLPVATYIQIPASGAFNMQSWLSPGARHFLSYSPFVQAMELLRYGIFGDRVHAMWDISVPIVASIGFILLGLVLCRRLRRELVVE
jgi:capsular polysaccharide transport system permease protein